MRATKREDEAPKAGEAIAIIGMVQGAGISKAFPNPDGEYPDVSRDFSGQGAANAVAGIFQGMPLGGSVASSALNVSAGAKSRWSNVFAGLIIVVVVLLFSPVISLVAMPAMAALLIMAGIQSIKKEEFLDVWDVPYDVAMATQNMQLMAHSLGLGTCVVVAPVCDMRDDMKTMKMLKVPHGYKVALPLAVGYPDESPNPRPRWALEDIVFYEAFGQGREK